MKITNNSVLGTSSIIVVRFYATNETYYFGSLAAIYEAFTAQDLGCRLYKLWEQNLNKGYDTGKCFISRGIVYRKRNKKPRAAAGD